MKGQIISGGYSDILIRKKSSVNIEVGELLVSHDGDKKILFQVKDLIYGSQISQANLELISGLRLEEDDKDELFDEKLRLYTLAKAKPILQIDSSGIKLPKNLPKSFQFVREVKEDDLPFIKNSNPLNIGKLRSGSNTLNLNINFNGEKVFSHHVLIPATTGRGKSNLLSNVIWDTIDKDYCGLLILDPHDEYYGRNNLGMKDHPSKDKLSYYTLNNCPAGQRTLHINIKKLKPSHFNGATNFTQAQSEAIYAYYKKYNYKWIEAILNDSPIENFMEGTIAVLKRKIQYLLDIEYENGLICSGAFQNNSGENTISDICTDLENAKTVIIDTSNFSGSVEILIGSLITTEIYNKYKYYKKQGIKKPTISVVLEEAPRVLGKDILENGPNVFSTIAREGRKFNIGLTAVTQLPSLIPRQILANMNTKIILGLEMQSERQAIIDSASQDLSDDSKTIASLDVGEAIISSNFMKFAVPVKIPKFDDYAKNYQNKHNAEKYKSSFGGLKK